MNLFYLPRNPTISARYDNDIAVNWLPVDRNNSDSRMNIAYLDFTERLALRTNPEEDRLHFWDALVDQYNGGRLLS